LLFTNEANFPGFTNILKELKIETQKTEMRFSFECPQTCFEFHSQSISGFLCNPSNFLKADFYKLVFEFFIFRIEDKLVYDPVWKLLLY
jgi:predicted NAD/FAD-binding protein